MACEPRRFWGWGSIGATGPSVLKVLHATQGPAGTWFGCHFGSVSLNGWCLQGASAAPASPHLQQDRPPCAMRSTPICCVIPILPSLPRQNCCLQTPRDSPCCPQLSPNSISQSFSGLNGKTHPHPHPWGLIPGKPSGGTTFQRHCCTCRSRGRFSTEVFPRFPPLCHQKHPNNQHPVASHCTCGSRDPQVLLSLLLPHQPQALCKFGVGQVPPGPAAA